MHAWAAIEQLQLACAHPHGSSVATWRVHPGARLASAKAARVTCTYLRDSRFSWPIEFDLSVNVGTW